MKSIAKAVFAKRQDQSGDDGPQVKRKFRLDPTKVAQSAMERYNGLHKDGDDFLSEDGPSFDSDEYINTTGLSDDGRMDIEGEGDSRKSMVMKAVNKARQK